MEELLGHGTEVDAIFGPYVKGKRRAEAAVAEQFGANGVILHLAHPFVVEAISLLPAYQVWRCSYLVCDHVVQQIM